MRFDDIKESAVMALDTLRTNKLRSALTILGVSVGVLTVIFMVSIIQGLNKAFADQIESLGSNTIFVSKFEPSFGRPPGPEEIHRKDLTMEDAEALRIEAPSIVGVSPIHRMIAATVRYQDKQTDTPILLGGVGAADRGMDHRDHLPVLRTVTPDPSREPSARAAPERARRPTCLRGKGPGALRRGGGTEGADLDRGGTHAPQ